MTGLEVPVRPEIPWALVFQSYLESLSVLVFLLSPVVLWVPACLSCLETL